ncbi:leucine-rich repeat protein [Lapidilactobacillus luobeiensis]|uniref:leucine-rich repeat protein n=1 Tax=Lapidilactobacillus luobeiensis TaxID=2950371 RepID=UPI0021C4606E|nr:leucine-rich repeat protein [Lapidilactobacillus luobeiensis]
MTVKSIKLHHQEHVFVVSLVGMATLLVLGEPPHEAQAVTPAVATTAVAAVSGQTLVSPASSSRVATAQSDFQWSLDDSANTATLTGVNSGVVLGAVVIPDTVSVAGKNYTVTAIGPGAFQSQESLTSVAFGSNLRSIGDNAFVYAGQLTTVDFSQATDLVTIGNNAFQSNGSLTAVALPASLTQLGAAAFEYDGQLTTVVLPAGLTAIAPETFTSCTSLRQVDFAPGSQLQTIGASAFAYNAALTSFALPATVQTIGTQAFAGAGQLTTVSIPTDTQLTEIAAGAFMYDGALTDFRFPDTLTTLGAQAFLGASALPSAAFGPNLTAIGAQAFLYDGGLKTLDFNRASALTAIQDQAFEYCGLTGALNLPQNLVTIAAGAFAGNHITAIGFPNALQSIGTSAFAYNAITGTLRVPSSITAIGADGFLGNQLEAVILDGDRVELGNDVFTYNRITTIHGNTVVNDNVIGRQNMATIFTDPAHVSIADYFSLAYNGRSAIEQDLTIDQLSDGVTYRAGEFTVPTGTKDFYFDWSLPENGQNVYSGRYHVVLSNPEIKAIDSTVLMGMSWDKNDNFVSAILDDGQVLDLNDLTVTIQDPTGQTVPTLDTTQAGVYRVTYQYGNYQTTVSVTVEKRPGTYTLTGNSQTVYSGQTQGPSEVSGYQLALSNGTTYVLKNGDLELTTTNAAQDAGQYQVQLSAQGLTDLQGINAENTYYQWTQEKPEAAKFTITPAPATITAADLTKYAGDADPTLTATVANPAEQTGGAPLVYDLTRQSGETAGEYPITVQTTPTANPNYNVKTVSGNLTILANQESITASDFTMYVGDPQPISADFKASATDKTGAASAVTIDLSQADFTQAGSYPVAVTSASGQSKTVTLTVKASAVSLTGNDFTMYVGDRQPTVADFGAQATAKDGTSLPVQVDLDQVNFTQAGTYPVQLSAANGLTKTIKLVLLPNRQSLTGEDFDTYEGQPLPSLADLRVQATDKSGQEIAVAADFSQVQMGAVGDYPVKLTTADGQELTVIVHVRASQRAISGQDYTMYVGQSQPTVADFKGVASDPAGQALVVNADFSQVDWQLAGDYPVTLTATDGQTKVVQLHLLANKQGIHGQDYTMYVGDPRPTVADFQAVAADMAGNSLPVSADLTGIDFQTAGNYPVKLTASDGQTLLVQLHLLANQQHITGQDHTMYVGEPLPTVTDFAAVATDKTGQRIGVIADLSQVQADQPGRYPVILTAVDGQRYTVHLDVKADLASLTARNYTMFIGDPLPTATSFKAVATDRDGQPEPAFLDLSQADLTKAGTYPVTLTTASGEEITVKLRVVAKYQQPEEPNQPEKPTKPMAPTKPVDPNAPVVKPTQPVQPSRPNRPSSSRPSPLATPQRPAILTNDWRGNSQNVQKGLPQTSEQRHIWPIVLGGLTLGLLTLGSWFRKFWHQSGRHSK